MPWVDEGSSVVAPDKVWVAGVWDSRPVGLALLQVGMEASGRDEKVVWAVGGARTATSEVPAVALTLWARSPAEAHSPGSAAGRTEEGPAW